MRTINVSTGVYAKIWSLREAGEETEDAILRRVLCCANEANTEQSLQRSDAIAPPVGGFHDRRFNVHFQEGFELFRNYLGTDYRARATGGHWVLLNDGRSYGSINELSRAIGAKPENAWVNWSYLAPSGERKAVSDLRDQSRISRRKSSAPDESLSGNSRNCTWRADVCEALRQLGGKAPLGKIYDKVEAIRKAAGRSVPRTLDAVVRQTLEVHSSDSANFNGGPDVFFMPEGRGAGVWALR